MKKLYIDADTLLHEVVNHFEYTKKEFGSDDEGEDLGLKKVAKKVDMKLAKKMFLDKVSVITASCEVEMSLNDDYPRFNGTVCVFTDSTNFRYTIYPDYKKSRQDKTKERSKEFHKLKKWAIKKHGVLFENTEADEVVHYYGRKGNPIASMDKDVYRQTHKVPVYDLYNKCFQQQTKEEAKNFMLIQAIMGDSTDGIKGIVGVGKVGAKNLLDEFGWNWKGVVKSYEKKGFTERDALLTRNLVDMSVFKGKKKGVVLF